ncbi:MAG: phosphoenolpyruvate--protein phosphotransferase [Gemmatimonadales bacterium]|nr:phosphoenolpyruvate--protein phosphotransferase [Gemmatimonadales bacterium]
MTGHILNGVGVSPGVAFAPALGLRWSLPDVPDRTVDDDEIDGEILRLYAAAADVSAQLATLRERTRERAGPEEAGIFDAQIMMTNDATFLGSVEALIREVSLSAETAYGFKALDLREAWETGKNAMLRERVADLTAIQLRMLRRLMHLPDDEAWMVNLDEQVVIIARELSPGLTVQFDRDHVVGFVCEEGTRTSHAAILAHSLGIPAVMGVRGARDAVTDGTMVLLDGTTGIVILDPTSDELELARIQASRRHKLEMQLEAIADQPAVTPDGHAVGLLGNIDLPEEIEPALHYGAEGVGLLRTEFLVTGRTSMPSENEQTEYFRRVGAAFAGKPVVIRTYDLGGDKFPSAFDAPHEANPFLGWRSIRVCLDQPDLFRPQLRALLRAAYDRDLQLMLPMIVSMDELARAKEMLAEESEALQRDGVRAALTLPVGVMIETPAAVILAPELVQASAFVSIGSNDLTQYTLAVDRGNARLADRFSSLHPAVVRQLAQVQRAAAAGGIPSSVCGEMASNPLAAVLLVGLGYDRLSIAPPSIPLVKYVVRHVPVAAARQAAADCLGATTTSAVEAILRDTLGRVVDMRLVDPVGALPRPTVGASFRT